MDGIKLPQSLDCASSTGLDWLGNTPGVQTEPIQSTGEGEGEAAVEPGRAAEFTTLTGA